MSKLKERKAFVDLVRTNSTKDSFLFYDFAAFSIT